MQGGIFSLRRPAAVREPGRTPASVAEPTSHRARELAPPGSSFLLRHRHRRQQRRDQLESPRSEVAPSFGSPVGSPNESSEESPSSPPKGGKHGNSGSIGLGIGFGGGSGGGTEETEDEAEAPETANAAIVVETESLTQVSVGATITLHGQGFGQHAGRVAIKYGQLLLATPTVKWDDSAARIVVPQVGLLGSAKATFLVMRADGSVASEIPFELVAARQSSITQE